MPKARDKHFDEFEPHTLLKHAILKTYLATWAMRLLQWGRAGDVVYFVDAFAGQGRDGVGNPGSPAIARCFRFPNSRLSQRRRRTRCVLRHGYGPRHST